MNNETKRKPNSNGKKTSFVCLIVVAVFFFAVTLLNIFQTNRPAYSESENRNLAEMPEFSFESLFSGHYFSDLSKYISDTFWQREFFVDLAKKMDLLKGFDMNLGGKDFVIIATPEETTTEDEEFWKRLESLILETETTEPVTTEAITTEPITSEPEESTEPISTEPLLEIIPSLSAEKINISEGSSQKITLKIEIINGSDGIEIPVPEWTEPDPKIATVKFKNDTVTITGMSAGATSITVTVGNNFATCYIDVFKPQVIHNEDGDDVAVLNNGIFIYGDSGYIQGNCSPKVAASFGKCADYYASIFPSTRISVIPVPVSAITIDDPDVIKKLKVTDERKSLNVMETYFSDKVNFVNLGTTMFEHRNEYLYFKTDHHWTQVGAYYAYVEFIRSIGEEPLPLDSMIHQTITTSYTGSYYRYTKNEHFKKNPDVIESWRPDVKLTMTVTTQPDANGKATTYTRNSVIVASHKTYLCFIGGDNPYTVINVSENPQDKSIIVFKDSYGDAFVPFLTAHYGNIIVIDPRHTDMNIYKEFKDFGLTDIVFLNNIQCANQTKWVNYYLRAVGK